MLMIFVVKKPVFSWSVFEALIIKLLLLHFNCGCWNIFLDTRRGSGVSLDSGVVSACSAYVD